MPLNYLYIILALTPQNHKLELGKKKESHYIYLKTFEL